MLHATVFYGKFEVVKILATVCEVDLNYQNAKGNTPLHIAVERAHKSTMIPIMKLLMELDCKRDVKNDAGKLAWEMAKDPWVGEFVKNWPKIPSDYADHVNDERLLLEDELETEELDFSNGEVNEMFEHLAVETDSDGTKYISVKALAAAFGKMMSQLERIEERIPDMLRHPFKVSNPTKGVTLDEFNAIVQMCSKPIDLMDE